MSQTTTNTLTAAQSRHALSIWVYYALTFLILLVFTAPIFKHCYAHGYGTGLSCFGIGAILLIAIGFAYLMKLPLSYYGFIKPNTKSLTESIVFSLLFCLIMILVKAILIHSVTSLKQYPLFMIIHGTPKWSTAVLWMYLLLYCIFAPFQCFIYHGVLQGPLTTLTQTRAKAWLTIIYTALFFTSVHTLFGNAFAIMVFLPGLVWCWIYYRHRSIVSISISHIIIGGIMLIICGAAPFITLINEGLKALS